MAFLFRVRWKIQSRVHWSHALARVVPGSIAFHRVGSFFGCDSKGLYIPEARFEYTCRGKSYMGSKLLPVGWTIRESERERVERELETFAVALCNPADPAEAYLDIPDRYQRGSISWITVGLVLAGLASLILGIILLAKAT